VTEDVGQLLREMYRDYANKVELPAEATYHNGTPLRPVVPLDCGTGGLFILGAYPSSRFMTVGETTDVPSADNMAPFESERWFDGTRVRHQPSARELQDCFLQPLGIDRASCWITDLVKVFLFKPGHVARYAKIGAVPPVGYDRKSFYRLGQLSLPWVRREIAIAQPRLVLTLGAEVAGVLRGVQEPARQVALLRPEVATIDIGGPPVKVVHCAHPGILMRRGPSNPWPERHWEKFVPEIKRFLDNGA
jgi:uracil-DNA glycosylase